MPKGQGGVFSREFEVAAVPRIRAVETIKALAASGPVWPRLGPPWLRAQGDIAEARERFLGARCSKGR